MLRSDVFLCGLYRTLDKNDIIPEKHPGRNLNTPLESARIKKKTDVLKVENCNLQNRIQSIGRKLIKIIIN